MKLVSAAVFVFLTTVSSLTSAQTFGLEFCSHPAESVPNVTITDIFVDFTGQLGGQQLFLQLDSGSVYNTPGFGGDTAPNKGFVGLVPELADDTFVTMGGRTLSESTGVLVVGGAVNIGGAPAGLNLGVPNDQLISVAWAPAAGVTIEDQSRFLIAQVALTDDATGVVFLFSSTLDGPGPLEVAGTVSDGRFGPLTPDPDDCIPEPTSLAMLVIAGAGWRRTRF